MKKTMLISVIAGLALFAFGSNAAAQRQVPNAIQKDRVARVRCPGNDAACLKLELYQKMAGTSSSAKAADLGAAKSAAAQNRQANARTRPSGGSENNPMHESGAAARPRPERREHTTNHPQMNRHETRMPSAMRAREVTRHRPTDY